MCGIIGYLGSHEAAPFLLEALKRLEYRGYDSAGFATVCNGHLHRRRAAGKLVNLSDALVHAPAAGKSGIGHTRWATHGAPTEDNAHPHCSGPVAVVHNGIIENFRELRDELAGHGITHETETDTEIVALLTNHYLGLGISPVEAATRTVRRLEGAFALAFLFETDDDLLVVARRGSPLAIGQGLGENFVGSDAIALAPLTDRIIYLEEGDIAVISRNNIDITDAQGCRAKRKVKRVRLDIAEIDKGGHSHFMAKEIAEQPRVIKKTLSHYLSGDSINLPDSGFDFTSIDRLTISACGTAHIACLTAKYWFETIARLPVEVDIASEFRYREPPIPPRTAALFVSQSGETADTLAALRFCEGRASAILSVVNVIESSIARASDVVLPIHAGVEVGVASTKAFTCQLTLLFLLALEAARQRGEMDTARQMDLLAQLCILPTLIGTALEQGAQIKELGQELAQAQDVLFLGRGLMYPIALEGALKLKEISYVHAEAYASGELKHGPIALIDSQMPVIVMAPKDVLYGKSVSNMQEVMARGGKVLLVSDSEGLKQAGEVWRSIEMPHINPLLTPMLYAVPAQLLAYHTAIAKGTDVDQPRNLAKSVTVE